MDCKVASNRGQVALSIDKKCAWERAFCRDYLVAVFEEQNEGRVGGNAVEFIETQAPSCADLCRVGLRDVRPESFAIAGTYLLGFAIERMRIVLPAPHSQEVFGILRGKGFAQQSKHARTIGF